MLAPRLEALAALLTPAGTLWVHVDWRASYLVRLILDEVMGRDAFVNEIVWRRAPNLGRQAASHQFGRTLDTLVVYGRARGEARSPTRLEPIEPSAVRVDREGRPFTTAPRGDYTDESIARLESEGRIHRTASGRVYVKYFLVKNAGRDALPRAPRRLALDGRTAAAARADRGANGVSDPEAAGPPRPRDRVRDARRAGWSSTSSAAAVPRARAPTPSVAASSWVTPRRSRSGPRERACSARMRPSSSSAAGLLAPPRGKVPAREVRTCRGGGAPSRRARRSARPAGLGDRRVACPFAPLSRRMALRARARRAGARRCPRGDPRQEPRPDRGARLVRRRQSRHRGGPVILRDPVHGLVAFEGEEEGIVERLLDTPGGAAPASRAPARGDLGRLSRSRALPVRARARRGVRDEAAPRAPPRDSWRAPRDAADHGPTALARRSPRPSCTTSATVRSRICSRTRSPERRRTRPGPSASCSTRRRA